MPSVNGCPDEGFNTIRSRLPVVRCRLISFPGVECAYIPAVRDGDAGPFPIPEPTLLALFGIGLAGLLAARRRIKN